MSTTKVMAGIAFGIAVGSVIGALNAPDKGSKTRKNLTNKGKQLAEELKLKVSEIMQELRDELMEDETRQTTKNANKKSKVVVVKQATDHSQINQKTKAKRITAALITPVVVD